MYDEELADVSGNNVLAISAAYILSYDRTAPVQFPHNGRTLIDDVVDVFLSTLTNGKVTGDKVGPHRDLLNEFPCLGPPHD